MFNRSKNDGVFFEVLSQEMFNMLKKMVCFAGFEIRDGQTFEKDGVFFKFSVKRWDRELIPWRVFSSFEVRDGQTVEKAGMFFKFLRGPSL